MELQELSSMDQADAREGHEAGLVIAPTSHGGGPLGGAAQLVHLMAAVDHAAIDQPRNDRRQLVRRGLEHRLVQLSETFLDPLLPDQGSTLIHQCEREEIGIAEALGDLGRGGGNGEGSVPVASDRVLELGGEEDVATLDAVTFLSIEQPLCPPKPARGARDLPAQREMDDEPERATHGALSLADFEVTPMRALQRTQLLLVAADQVGRCCETFQILGTEHRGPISTRKRLVNVLPRTFRVRAPAASDVVAPHAAIVARGV